MPSLTRSTLTLVAGGILAHLLPLLLGPLLVRLYDPQAFGQYALMWAIATNLAVVACGRYEFALPLEQDESDAATLMALCAHWLVAVTAVAALVGGLLSWHLGLTLGWMLPLAVVVVGAMQWLTMWATRLEHFRALSAARVAHHGGGAVLQVVLGWLAWGTSGLMLGPVLAGLAALGLLAMTPPGGGWKQLGRMPWSALRAMALRHRAFPLLNTPHAFLGALQDTLALVLLAAWAGDAQAGLWALAMRYLKAPATLLGGAISQALYPQLVRAPNLAAARLLVRKTVATLVAFAVPLLVALWIWGPALWIRVFSAEWADAAPLVQAGSLYIALHFIASPLSVVTLAWRAQAWALKLAVVGQVAFFSGLLLGLQANGLTGAAWGVSFAMLAYFVYYFYALTHWPHHSHESPAEPVA